MNRLTEGWINQRIDIIRTEMTESGQRKKAKKFDSASLPNIAGKIGGFGVLDLVSANFAVQHHEPKNRGHAQRQREYHYNHASP